MPKRDKSNAAAHNAASSVAARLVSAMNLDEAELQQLTGHPIARGHLSIGPEGNGTDSCIPQHDRLLLMGTPQKLIIRPVTSIARNRDGFCEVTVGEPGVEFEDLEVQNLDVPGSPFVRSGNSIGCLHKRWPDWRSTVLIGSYELRSECCAAGLHFAISGKFEGLDILQNDSMLNGKSFSIDAMIPWATLALKDFRCALGYQKFNQDTTSPAKEDSPDRLRDPRKLGDLLIDRNIFARLVRGRLLLFPESNLPIRIDPYDARFLQLGPELDQESIWFHDVPRIETFGGGFAYTSPSLRYAGFVPFGWTMIERMLAGGDSFSMILTGGDLGSVGYAISPPLGPGYTVSQPIKSVSIRGALTQSGLEIAAEGELGDLDVAENLRNSGNPKFTKLQSNPIRTFALEATVPWALLAVKGMGLARRISRF